MRASQGVSCRMHYAEMQLAELREYAERRGWQIVEEFTDQGVSGCIKIAHFIEHQTTVRVELLRVAKAAKWLPAALNQRVASGAEPVSSRLGWAILRNQGVSSKMTPLPVAPPRTVPP
jgi:hypothetical protein